MKSLIILCLLFTFTFAHYTLDLYENEGCTGNATEKFTDLELDECKDISAVIGFDDSIKLTKKNSEYTGKSLVKTFANFNMQFD